MCNRITRSRRPIWNSVTWRFYEAMPLLLCLAAQSCPTLCNPMDCSPPGSSVHGDSPGKKTGVGCCALLRGIFPTQGLNPGPPHCRGILHHLSYQGSPRLMVSTCFNCIRNCQNILQSGHTVSDFHQQCRSLS